ncbi:MAG: endonuclease/exonuclease/phosphatase family protein, partial [Bdellovibrionota bacterium]
MNTFRILTFNTWLVRTPFGIDVAKKINERFSLLPDSLASLDADVICLQEVWSPALRRSLREKMAALGYPHCAGGEKIGSASFFILRFIHNFFGNGLLIFSRYPISTVVQPSIFRKF